MRVKVLQEDLLKGLNIASRFVATRSQLPILSNVLLSTTQSGLKIASTNLEMGVCCFIGAKIETEGAITIPARTLVEIIANMPSGQINLEVEKEQLTIINQKAKVLLTGILPSDFPKIPDYLEKVDFKLSSSVLNTLKSQVVFSSSSDEARPVLTGVLFKFFEDHIQVVATDGFRLSCKEVDIKTGINEGNIILSAKMIDEVSKIAGESETLVEVAILNQTKQVMFSLNNCVMTGRLIDGEFPNFDKIIPKSHTFQGFIEKEEFVKAIKIIGVIARESANVMRLKTNKEGISLFAENKQYGQEEIQLEAQTLGDELEMAFNYKFIQDFLNSVKGEEVCFETSGSSSPGVFKEKKDNSYFHLIMPVKIQDQ